jgi:RNA polymerase sigma-70 factor (ECF subfamily)
MAKKLTQSEQLTVVARRMKDGDPKAAAELYEDLLPKVYGFLFSRTGKKEIAEDLSQRIFIKLIEKIKGFDPKKGRFTVWFWQMVRHELIDYYRQKKEIPFSTFDEETVAGFAVMETPNLEEKFRYYQVKDFVGTLASHERELFELRYVAELPFNEIAVVMAKSEGALRVAALRVKEKVRREFENAE